MVVDGRLQFTGNDTGKAARAIAEAAKIQKGKVEIVETNGKLKVKISDLPEHEAANIFLAIAEDNLTTSVARGENSGKRLEHQSVVRELKSIGLINAREKSAELENILQLQPAWKRENLKIIVFVQENESRKIQGVGRIPLEKK